MADIGNEDKERTNGDDLVGRRHPAILIPFVLLFLQLSIV
jgi:hypothetical protein